MTVNGLFTTRMNRRTAVKLAAAGLLASQIPATSPQDAVAQAQTSPIAPPDVTAKAIYVMDATAGVTLYSKNPDERLQIGSVVKVMTALVTVKHIQDPDAEQVTITEDDLVDITVYSNMQLQAGDTLTVTQLLYGVMLPSGGDGAKALARHIGEKISGSTNYRVAMEAFVGEMNAYATELGLDNTRFTNPDGADSQGAYSSAEDVYLMTAAMTKDQLLMNIMKEPAYQFTSVGPEHRTYAEQSTNKFLLSDPAIPNSGVIGGKTGTEVQAGGNVTLIRDVNNGNNKVVIVILNASHEFTTGVAGEDKRWDDALALISAMDSQFTWASPADNGVIPGLSEQMMVWDVAFQDPPAIPVSQVPEDPIAFLLQVGAPTDPGERAGTVHLYFGESQVGELPVYQAQSGSTDSREIA